MKVGDLVRHIGNEETYGFVVCIVKNKWIGSRCQVVWLENNFPKKWYAFEELEVLNEKR